MAVVKKNFWIHEQPLRDQGNDAAKINERTDADPIVTMLRELMQNLVDAEKVGSEHLVEISLFTDTHSSHHMKTTLDDVVDRAAASSEVSSSDITVNSTLVIHETGYAGLTGPMQQITPFKNASKKTTFTTSLQAIQAIKGDW